MVNLRATLPGATPGRRIALDHRRPLRHQAVQGVHVRRRQRRRLERRVPDRAGARAEDRAPTRCRSSCCSSTARKRSSSGRAPTTPTAAATTSTPRARPARSNDIRALVLVDMIGDRDLRHHARAELDALADRHHLGRGEAARARASSSTARRRSRTTTCRSSRPACRRSTSSTSTTPPGTPPDDTLDKVARGILQAVGDVLLAALPEIEKRLLKP